MTTAPHAEHAHHVTPIRVLLSVFGALIALTVATVAVRYVDLGSANIWIALGVAGVKAVLVAVYFMHLRHDNPFNAIVLVVSLLTVILFVGIALMDTKEYHPNLTEPTVGGPAG